MNYNLHYSNGNNDPKNLPLKAYFLNKYEPLKEPSTNNISTERSVLDNLLLDTTTKYPRSELQETQKNLYLTTNDLVDYNNNQFNSNTSTSTGARHFNTETLAKNLNSKMSGSNSDEEEEFVDTANNNQMYDRSREEKRRISHTAAEQKRRNAIKRGYDDLQSIVPSCEFMDPSSSQKVCKATVLKRSIDYIHEMEKEKDNHEQELDSLKKEIIALKIMKSNYEEILQFHKNQPKDNNVEINDDAVFDLFVKFSDNLFQSFQSMISANSFAEMTSSTLNWLEQQCTTNNLKNLVLLSLYQAIR